MLDDRPRIWPWMLALAAVLLVPAIMWGASVLFSPVAGRGNQIKDINRAENRTFSQQHFETLYGDVKTYDQQLAVQTTARDSVPADDQMEQSRMRAVVAGLQGQCLSVVQQYNADSNKVSVGAFKDTGLPVVLPDGPETDCK